MASKKHATPGTHASALKKLKAAVSLARIEAERNRKIASKNGRKKGHVLSSEILRPLLKDVPKNPFELKMAKHKYEVLQRTIRGNQGKPEISRTRGLELRKAKLLPELKRARKVNMFQDKRFGEDRPNMSLEEKMIERFTMERQRTSRHNNIYNLEDEEGDGLNFGEEEDLMHYGRPISRLDRLGDVHISDGDDEDGNLDARQVSEFHFGGFLNLKNESRKEGQDEQEEPLKTKKDIMEDIIAKSKMYRMERQQQRMETEDLVQQLDEDFGNLRTLLLNDSNYETKTHEAIDPKSEDILVDDYDRLVKELIFETRVKPTDRLKTPEEIAQEEKKKLDKLESDRLKRMRDEESSSDETERIHVPHFHQSADALGNDYITDKGDVEPLTYKDGILVEKLGHGSAIRKKSPNQFNLEETSQRDLNVDSFSKNVRRIEKKSRLRDESDPVMSKISIPLDRDGMGKETAKSRGTVPNMTSADWTNDDKKKSLPYIFDTPSSLEDLYELTRDRSLEDRLAIIDRILVCNHIKLSVSNRPKMELFFKALMEYMKKAMSRDDKDMVSISGVSNDLKLINKLIPLIYRLIDQIPDYAASYFHDFLMEHQASLSSKNLKTLPALDSLVIFRLIISIYPTSDFQHPIVTPCLLLMSQYLEQCSLRNIRDATSGLFICSILFTAQRSTKRYIPEVINFLNKILLFILPEDVIPDSFLVTVPTADSELMKSWKCSNAISLESSCLSTFPLISILSSKPSESSKGASVNIPLFEDSQKVSLLVVALDGLYKWSCLYQHEANFTEIFGPLHSLVKHVLETPKHSNLLKILKCHLEILDDHLDAKITDINNSRKFLRLQVHRAIPLKSFEPCFQESYSLDRRSRNPHSSGQDELRKLRHLHKREFKGALRELRKDNQFLARHHLESQLEHQRDYQNRINKITHDLEQQQSEANTLKRKRRA